MNFGIIKRTIGWLLLFETAFFLVPLITALCYQEEEIYDFLATMIFCAAVGALLLIGKPKTSTVYAKEGFVIVALGWIVLSLFGALPFWFSKTIPSYIDALFETVSGFTTTGASILDSSVIEGLPKSILIWRSFTHWVGGMGVLVFIMVFLPLSGGGHNMNILKAESPGPTVSKLVPKMRQTAKILYLIYATLTVLQLLFLICGGMPLFDAINAAFATAGTGGFAIKADGFNGYSSYLQIVVTVFMLIFSINFNSYYMMIKGRWKEVLTAEVKAFLIIVGSAIGLITLNVLCTQTFTSFGEALKHVAFSVASIISTTGFATENFDLWPAFSKTILVLLMFIGSCAGSTGGGIKVSRMLVLFKGTSHELKRKLHPKQVKKITMDGRVVEDEVIHGVRAFLIAYIAVFIVSLLVISLECQDMTTNFTAVAATMNNIGPGLGFVGPAGNFSFYSWWSKLVLIFDMLVGRLEVFPMLLLFAPATWRK